MIVHWTETAIQHLTAIYQETDIWKLIKPPYRLIFGR